MPIRIAASNSSPSDKAVADAICTGIDDQSTINNWLDAKSNIPDGNVLLFNGNYNVSGPIWPDDHINISGSGWKTVIDGSSITHEWNLIQLNEYCSLQNMKFVNNISIPREGFAYNVSANNYCILRNLYVKDMVQGIDCTDKHDILIENCKFKNIRNITDEADCILVIYTAHDITIRNIIAVDSNRFMEIEAGPQNILVENVYLKNIQNYNNTGREAFSIDCHSHSFPGWEGHNPEPGDDGVIYQNMYLENCHGINCRHAATPTLAAGMPRNVHYENIVMKNITQECIINGFNITAHDLTFIDCEDRLLFDTRGPAANTVTVDNVKIYDIVVYFNFKLCSIQIIVIQ